MAARRDHRVPPPGQARRAVGHRRAHRRADGRATCRSTPCGCPGIVADQDVILGDVAQTLTIAPRHDRPHELHARRAAGRPPRRGRCPTRSPSGSSACSGRAEPPLVAVTDHAVERYRQRVPRARSTRGRRSPARVARAWAAGAVARAARRAPRRSAARSTCATATSSSSACEDRPRGELLVVTLWEEGEDPRCRGASPTPEARGAGGLTVGPEAMSG